MKWAVDVVHILVTQSSSYFFRSFKSSETNTCDNLPTDTEFTSYTDVLIMTNFSQILCFIKMDLLFIFLNSYNLFRLASFDVHSHNAFEKYQS